MGLVGLAMTYYALSLAFNRTLIRLTSLGELSVWHGPLPWRGNRRLNAADIKQFFCLPTSWHVNGRPYYDVWMLQADLTRRKFVGGLPEIDQALFIEQTLESALGLPDEPVPGEVA